ncbi:hypothetical protein E2C01_068233 [Portunus trituberculatus]|uniref:Uncharacterized protein n=1 Tax=Portunus trituberculatus TaxID=210409 RepID=A0A5B7HRD5_PORTR|nr:hypothetical protein [Portunus trituberculatus]
MAGHLSSPSLTGGETEALLWCAMQGRPPPPPRHSRSCRAPRWNAGPAVRAEAGRAGSAPLLPVRRVASPLQPAKRKEETRAK